MGRLNQQNFDDNIPKSESLAETLRKYERIISATSDAICLADQNYVYKIVNQAYLEWFGKSYAEVVNQPMPALLGTEFFDKTIKARFDLSLAGQTVHYQEWFEFPALGRQCVSVTQRPYVEADGSITEVVTTLHLITEFKRTEEALRQNERRIEMILSGTDLGIWEFDLATGMISVNERMVNMLGYALTEVDGDISWWDKQTHPDDLPLIMANWEAHLAEKNSNYQQEYRLRSKTGEWVWVLDRGKIVEWDELGKPLRVVGTHLDITAYKQAEESTRQVNVELERRVSELFTLNLMAQTVALVTHLKTALDMVVRTITGLFNVYGASISLLNEKKTAVAVYAHFERERLAPEIIGRNYLLVEQPMVNWAIDARQTVVLKNAQEDARIQSLAGFLNPEQLQGVMIIPLRAHGVIIGVISIASEQAGRDFSTAEIALAETVAGQIASAVEIARLLEQERDLRQMAEVQNKELDAFAHTVAHDLKGPLGHVITYTDYVISYAHDMSLTELVEIIDKIKQAGLKAVNITDELLILAGVRKRAVSITPLNMAEIVPQALRWLEPMLAEYQGQIILPESWPTARGYAPWVEEVWLNYLSNSLKYGGRPAKVEVGGHLQGDGQVCFWVKDNGEGVMPEAQANLFAEFTRFSEIRVEGHGLGLSIVRRIVEKLGGRVGVESSGQSGQGSMFYFTLPSHEID
jgi:PAS domain S-box-containing protein